MLAVKISPEAEARSENRRDWALMALFGGAVVMTLFAAFAMYWVSDNPKYVLWLGLAAHAQIVISISALAGLLVKRSLKVSRTGLEIVDQEIHTPPRGEQDGGDVIDRKLVEEKVEEAIDEVPAVLPEKGNDLRNK